MNQTRIWTSRPDGFDLSCKTRRRPRSRAALFLAGALRGLRPLCARKASTQAAPPPHGSRFTPLRHRHRVPRANPWRRLARSLVALAHTGLADGQRCSNSCTSSSRYAGHDLNWLRWKRLWGRPLHLVASALMAGDQADRDILFAGQAGLRTCYFPGNFVPFWSEGLAFAPDFQIESYAEVPAALRTLQIGGNRSDRRLSKREAMPVRRRS